MIYSSAVNLPLFHLRAHQFSFVSLTMFRCSFCLCSIVPVFMFFFILSNLRVLYVLMCSSYLCAIVPLSFLFLCSSYVLYVLLFLFQISFVPPIFVVLFLCSSYLFFIVSSVHYPLFLLSMFYFSPVHVYFFLLPMCYCSSSKFFCSSYFCSIVPLPFLCLSYLLMYICTYVLLFILPINQCSSFLCSVVSAFY